MAASLAELREFLEYDKDTGVFRWIKTTSWRVARGDVAGTVGFHGYRSITLRGKQHKAHRLAILFSTGQWPTGFIDHIDGDRDNNRICNLRPCTQSENMANSKRHGDSLLGLKGVTRKREKYQARIFKEGQQINLGVFGCPTAAHFAYVKAARALSGEFARAS